MKINTLYKSHVDNISISKNILMCFWSQQNEFKNENIAGLIQGINEK